MDIGNDQFIRNYLMQQQQSKDAQQQHPAQMPDLQQQIYNFNSPTGKLANPSSGSYDPTQQNLNTQYAGPGQANPLQPNYLGAPPTGQATTFAGAQLGQGVDQNLLNQFSGQNTLGMLQQQIGGNLAGQVGPQAAEQQLLSAFAPAQASATRSLNDSLAAMGLSGGPAIQAQTQLQSQLGAGLGQSLAGLISQGQGNMLNLYGQNAGIMNQGNQNQLGLISGQAGFNQQTGFENQRAMNNMTGQNLQNAYNTNAYNTTAANDANAAFAASQQNAYNQNLSNFQNMNQQGYTGATNFAGNAMGSTQNLAGQTINTFPVQSGMAGAFSNLGASLGQRETGGQNPFANSAGKADMQNSSFGGY